MSAEEPVLARALEWTSGHTREDRVMSGPRLVRDSRTGEMVSVVERRADGVAGARGPSCLIFSTELGFTRIWDYPRNWKDIGDDELIGLTSSLCRRNVHTA